MIDRLRAIGGSGNEKALARTALALTASLLMVGMLFASPSLGAAGSYILAQASGSPSPSGTGAGGAAIFLLNPSEGYNPALPVPPQPPGRKDPPKISDKFDGDSTYHVVAWTKDAPSDALVEAYWVPDNGFETTVGELSRVAGSDNLWHLQWDIPATFPEGAGEFRVELFNLAFGGPESVATAKERAEVRHQGTPTDDPLPAEDTVELTWPTIGGALGFHKGRIGAWRTVVDGFASADTQRVFLFYSVSPEGTKPAFKSCGTSRVGAVRPDTSRPLIGANSGSPPGGTCTLAATDLPTSVTALAAVAIEDDKPQGALAAEFTQDSADVHPVKPYVQDVATMKVNLAPVQYFATSATTPTGQRRVKDVDCLEFTATVTDHLGRPVQGANLDTHLQGPDDQVGFGQESDVVSGSSASKVPDKGAHSTESSRLCDDFIDTPQDDRGDPDGAQGDHNVPGGPDQKHVETTAGTGVPESADDVIGPGQWRFHVFSEGVGFTDITAWVDEAPAPSDLKELREFDDDLQGTSEPSATLRAQWLPQALTIALDPAGASGFPGECKPFTVRVRSGSRPVPGINVDLHATGPDSNLDFCDPPDASPRHAPDDPVTPHEAEDPGESTHAGAPPQPQHTEGETDEGGNFLIGVTSPVTGDSTLEAWVDGEPSQNNDLFGAGEVRAVGTINWLSSLAEAELSFVNPSFYGSATSGAGNGTRVAATPDADSRYHVVVRVDALGVPGVSLAVQPSGGAFRTLGDMTPIPGTDLWEFYWNVDAADGAATLRAQIPNTDRMEDVAINVNNVASATDPSDRPYETVEMTSIVDGQVLAFSRGATEIRATASAGAEGVEFYYTKSAAKDTPQGADWIYCGYVDLLGTGTSPQEFKGSCTLDPADQAGQVSGIAALTFDCSPPRVNDGCDGNPFPKTPTGGNAPRQPGEKDSGDAHRVFGLEGSPVLALEPAEAQLAVGFCQNFEIRVSDQNGSALAKENVDVHVTGPDGVRFCDPEGASPRRAPADGGHVTGSDVNEAGHEDGTKHIEAETGGAGKVVFGIISDGAGDSTLTAWIDRLDNDQIDSTEVQDASVMHWVTESKAGTCTKVGTGKRDVLRGTPRRDKICGKGGNDVIRGLGGNDILVGGRGHDKLLGGAGRDRLKGGLGNDRLDGNTGRDNCTGGRGRDAFANCERRRR